MDAKHMCIKYNFEFFLRSKDFFTKKREIVSCYHFVQKIVMQETVCEKRHSINNSLS